MIRDLWKGLGWTNGKNKAGPLQIWRRVSKGFHISDATWRCTTSKSLDSKTVQLTLMAKEFETGKVCHIRALWEHRQCRRVNNKLKQSVEDRRRYAGWESRFLQALMLESHARKQSRRYIVRKPNPSKLHFLPMTAYHDVLQTPTNRGSQKLQETRCHFYARGQPTLSTAFHFTPTRQSQVDTEAWPSFYDTCSHDRFRRRGINSHSIHYVSGETEWLTTRNSTRIGYFWHQ